ncbi:hypothetical protein [Paenibacillus sinopodophylli]|uniref:hypothetical protein n=1 Tax=Paenibacillus sinopodophylli TaxID=1837342 RepID=UPI001BB29EAA|nr:hypothetical protein [Paenibacillus sinopodophylli]
MNGYEHYIRTNEAGIIIHGFSSAFEQPLATDHLYAENASRHFHESFSGSLTNERGQYRFMWDGEIVPRTQQELDAEWLLQPPKSPTAEERIAELEEENLSNMLALVELHGLILSMGGES